MEATSEHRSKSNASNKKMSESSFEILSREFDPGSGRTLAACLTHASRTDLVWSIPSGRGRALVSGGRVSNA